MASATPNSPTLAVRALAVSESFSLTKRYPIEDAATVDARKEMKQLRNILNQAASRNKADTGSNFRVESGAIITDDRSALILMACVTRMTPGDVAPSDDDEDDGVDI